MCENKNMKNNADVLGSATNKKLRRTLWNDHDILFDDLLVDFPRNGWFMRT